ncbi:GNAT family N-acetyltransferase [Microbacterium invictum]|uniref:Ribosomal protein S18 acetylase RimI-like enzyme n=1 Tax=Microbacterium invictum TaxID=515415 RepID=A0AA40SNK5_9MICO|nr:GNAT family N-acetyltransferase [Microbacterium invictum]MBB4139543.1 ribosomal protein S18 acetylase RimI-like enzyme [Microbacterium invictum]
MVSLRAVSTDDPTAHELLAEYFAVRAEEFPGATYTTVFPDPAAFEPPDGVFLIVTTDEGRDVGCGGIRRIADGPDGVRYEVKHLYLRAETRGRGWGRTLLDALEERARAVGAAAVVLDTHHTLTAAGGLYSRNGYAEIAPYNANPNATRWYGKRLTR